jgi:hypothetical protein
MNIPMPLDSDMGAVFSRCRTWRYTLWRDLTPDRAPVLNVIGLNPSTATERTNDPTVRRCIGFAKWLHCGQLVVTNIFAYRATNPADMKAVGRFAVGPENDRYLLEIARTSQIVVAAWGVLGTFMNREHTVLEMLRRAGITVHCFGQTKDGYPKHPLYLASHTPLEVYRRAHGNLS